MNSLIKNNLRQPMVLTGLLFVFHLQVQAAEYNSFEAIGNNKNITLNDGDKIIADTRYIENSTSFLSAIHNASSKPDSSGANIHLANGVSVIANGYTEDVRAITLGNSSKLEANNLSIIANGNKAVGLTTSLTNQVDLGTGSSIDVIGTTSATGIHFASGDMKANALKINVISNGDRGAGLDIQGNSYPGAYSAVNLGSNSSITVKGNGVHGIASRSAQFLASQLLITTDGDGSHGFRLSAGFADLGNGSTIITNGPRSTAISINAKFKADELTVVTHGIDSTALYFKGIVDIGAGSHFFSENGHGIWGDGKSELTFGGTESNRNSIFSGGGVAVRSEDGANLNLANTDIIVGLNTISKYTPHAGIYSKSGKVDGENLSIIGDTGSIGINTQGNGQVNLFGKTIIKMATATDLAMTTADDNTAALPLSQINAHGLMDIQGSIAANKGFINLDMYSGSILTGSTSVNSANGSMLNMVMDGSLWNMSDNSSVSKLVLNNSLVDFAEGSVLTVSDLGGNGTFIMRTDIVGDGDGINNFGDKLIVTGTSTGNHLLKILNRGSLATKGNEVLTLVETQDGQATFNSTHQVELGGYLYDVRKSGTNWELYGSGAVVSTPTVTTTADASANFLNVGYLMNYAETQTLLQRMGDLRQNSEHGDMWLRGFAGKFDSFSGGKLSQFDMSYSGMQIGADKRVSQEMPVFVGVFMGQTQGSPDYRSGDGTTKSSNAGIYGSYMAVNGFYMDAVAKYSHMKNNFSVKDSQDNLVRGNGNSDGVSFSLEAGQKFNMVEQSNGLYIEPQLQLAYGHQDATRIKASNGLRVDLGSYESLMGRASALLGYELNQGDSKVNVYLKTGIVREFKGDVDYQLNGSTENHTFNGNWWNNGVGVSTQINKQHTLYLDLDSSTGNKFNQRQINGGYRFSF